MGDGGYALYLVLAGGVWLEFGHVWKQRDVQRPTEAIEPMRGSAVRLVPRPDVRGALPDGSSIVRLDERGADS